MKTGVANSSGSKATFRVSSEEAFSPLPIQMFIDVYNRNAYWISQTSPATMSPSKLVVIGDLRSLCEGFHPSDQSPKQAPLVEDLVVRCVPHLAHATIYILH